MKEVYVLLDLAGNVERESEMTAAEAKEQNWILLWEQPRFLRWVEKSKVLWLFGRKILNH